MMKYEKAEIVDGKIVIKKTRDIDQSKMTEECWEVQFNGLEYCSTCNYKDKDTCGGKNIRKKGKNKKGFSVPL